MIKDLLPRQVVCNEKNEKGKPCHGALKRYYPFAGYYNEGDETLRGEIQQEFGRDPGLVLLKCEECGVIYRLPEVLKTKFG
ncbi:MAG: hypothetical protein ACE5JX_04520 [Acidobacteriota bacterium]